jgi:N-acyl-phosphatidylethanolamine-hydrolysing phospholipase D
VDGKTHVHALRILSLVALSLSLADMTTAAAPRANGRFYNPTGTRDWPSVFTTVPFFARKAWTSIVGRSGGATLVPFDPHALRKNPGVTWIGHSTMLVRMSGLTFLTDPIFSERASPLSFAGPERLVPPGVPLDALPPVDFVLLSHDHYDHTDLPSVEALAKRGIPFVVPLGLGELVRSVGGKAEELDWWETAERGKVRVHCVPAQHFAGRGLNDGNRRLWAGWVVEGKDRRFYHAGDTGYFSGFKEIGERLGPIDLAAIPIGAYSPASIMRFVHLDPKEAIQAGLDVRAKHILGMHYGTFDLTDEPPDEPPRWFHAEARRRKLAVKRVWTFNVGETRAW